MFQRHPRDTTVACTAYIKMPDLKKGGVEYTIINTHTHTHTCACALPDKNQSHDVLF